MLLNSARTEADRFPLPFSICSMALRVAAFGTLEIERLITFNEDVARSSVAVSMLAQITGSRFFLGITHTPTNL